MPRLILGRRHSSVSSGYAQPFYYQVYNSGWRPRKFTALGIGSSTSSLCSVPSWIVSGDFSTHQIGSPAEDTIVLYQAHGQSPYYTKIWVSTDNGANYTDTSVDASKIFPGSRIRFDRNNKDTGWIVGGKPFGSTNEAKFCGTSDSGSTWGIASPTISYSYPTYTLSQINNVAPLHNGSHAYAQLDFSGSSDRAFTVYKIGTDGSTVSSIDYSDTELSTSFFDTYGIEVDPTDTDTFYLWGADSSNYYFIYRVSYGGETYTALSNFPTIGSNDDYIALTVTNSGTVLVFWKKYNGAPDYDYSLLVERSTDQGDTWTEYDITSQLVDQNFSSGANIDVNSDGTIIGDDDYHVLWSINDGVSWSVSDYVFEFDSIGDIGPI